VNNIRGTKLSFQLVEQLSKHHSKCHSLIKVSNMWYIKVWAKYRQTKKETSQIHLQQYIVTLTANSSQVNYRQRAPYVQMISSFLDVI